MTQSVWLDGVAKRQLAISIFVLVQSAKLSLLVPILFHIPWISPFLNLYSASDDLLAFLSSPLDWSTILYLWCALDTLYFLTLKACRIPWLTFTFLYTLCLILGFSLLNSGLIATLSSLGKSQPSNLLSATSPSGSIPPVSSSFKSSQTISGQSDDYYLSGSHTIRHKQLAIAKWNPNRTSYCSSPSSEPHIIPILMKGKAPFEIEIEAAFPNGTSALFRNIHIGSQDRVRRLVDSNTGKDTYSFLPKVKSDSVVESTTLLYGWSAQEPGSYNLKSIKDSLGDEGKVAASSLPILISPCPTVHWHTVFNRESVSKCVDESFSTLIHVEGIFPLTIYYSTHIGFGQPIVSSVIPASLEGTLVPYSGNVGLTVPILSPELHTLRLLRIVDGYNHTIDLTDDRNVLKRLTPVSGASSYRVQSLDEPSIAVQGRSHPTVSFSESSITPFKLRTFFDPSVGQEKPVVPLQIRLNGVAPFTLNLSFSRDEQSSDRIFRTITIVDPSVTSIPVDQSGAYRLESVSDQYCAGTVEIPLMSIVEPVDPPTFDHSSSPIEEACVGAIGANVNLAFSGYPPFWIEYVVEVYEITYGQTRKPRMVSRYVERTQELDKPRHLLKFEPTEPGSYKYIFTKVGDANYPDGVPISTYPSVSQVIHPHSNARFMFPHHHSPNNKFTKCLDDTVSLDVSASGVGPWKVVYDIRHGSKSTRFTLNVPLDSSTQKIVLGGSNSVYALNSSGTYVVDLVEITDGNGCSRALDSSDVVIEVLPQKPKVGFYMATIPSVSDRKGEKAVVKMLDSGSMSLPLSFTGRGPFELEYLIRPLDGGTSSGDRVVVTNMKQRDSIHLNRPGIVELVGVRDQICSGTIDANERIRVELIEKPTATLISNVKKGLYCLGESDSIQVTFSGKGPFRLQYRHTWTSFPGTSSPVSQLHEQDVVGNTFEFPLAASNSGLHQYDILSISDQNYKSWTPVNMQPLKQFVTAPPSALFEDPSERVLQCLDQDNNHLSFPIRLEGIPPFNLRLGIQYGSQKADYVDLVLKERDLSQVQVQIPNSNVTYVNGILHYVPKPLNETGRYVFFLEHLMDGNGCAQSFTNDATLDTSADRFSNKMSENGRASSKSLSPYSTSVSLVSQAKIMPKSSDTVCVGDTIYYGLEGTPPFTVSYTWNGLEQSPLTVGDPMLSFWAGAPGTLKIERVCNGLDCCSSPHDPITTYVKGIPRAVMDGGQDIVDDIREGDESQLSVEFSGEPPFSFTYSRTVSSDIGPEAITISDIQTNRWSTVTNLEGVFKVTAIQDKYCSYPRIMTPVDGANAVLQ